MSFAKFRYTFIYQVLVDLLEKAPYLIALGIIAYFLSEISRWLGGIWYIFYISSGGLTS